MTGKVALGFGNRDIWLAVAFGGWAAAIALVQPFEAKAALAFPALAAPATWWMFQTPARWIEVFFAAALLLPPIPAPFGDAGPHPSLLIAAAGLFAGVLWLPRWRIPSNALTASLAALFAVLLASVAQAALHAGAEGAVGSLARAGLFGIGVYVFFYTACLAAPDRGAVRRLYWLAVAAAAFACVDFYFQLPAPAGYGPQFVWLDSGIYRRAQGFFYEANTLGNFCAFFLTMIAVSLTRPRAERPVSRKALFIGALAFCAALMLSYSRGSAANLGVSLAALIWLNRSRVRWARVLPALAGFGAAAGFVAWKIFPAFTEVYWLRLSATTEFLFSATEGVLSGRVESWRTVVNWLVANPWQAVLGAGYKTLPYSDYAGHPVVADNMYLSALAEMGILGFAALLWFCAAILRASYNAARRRNSFFGAWIFCFWAGEMTQMCFGDLLTYWRVLPIYFWVLALAVKE